MAELATALTALLEATSWSAIADIVDNEPELLSTDVAAALRTMIGSDEVNELQEAAFDDLRLSLARCAAEQSSEWLRQRQDLLWADVERRFAETLSEGLAANERFQDTGNGAHLERAVGAYRRLQDDLDFTNTPSGFQLLVFDGLAVAQMFRYEVYGDRAALDAGIALAQAAADRTSPEAHLAGRRFTNLAGGLLMRAGVAKDAADLAAGAQAAYRAVSLTDPDDPLWPGRVNNLVGALVTIDREGGDADDPLPILQEAIELAAEGSPEQARLLHALGFVWRERYKDDDSPESLNQAIGAFQRAASAAKPNHPDRGLFFSDLAIMLGVRFEDRGDEADLDQAVDQAIAAVRHGPPGHPSMPHYLTSAGLLLRTRFNEGGGNRGDLTSAAEYFRAAWQLSSKDGAADALNRYGDTLQQLLGALQREMVAAQPAERSSLHLAIGRVALDLFRISDEARLFGQALRSFEEAVATASPDEKVGALTGLLDAVRENAHRTGDRSDFDSAVEFARQILDHNPEHGPSINNLGLSLAERYRAFRSIVDLDEAIVYLRIAADVLSPEDPNGAGVVSNLVVCLLNFNERTGDAAALDEAIERGEAAIAAYDRSTQPWFAIVAATADGLIGRFERGGPTSDIDRAVELSWEATDGGRTRPELAGTAYNALGGALRARFGRDGNLEDLDQAISAYRISAETDKDPASLSNLGSALRKRASMTGSEQDLDAALDALAAATDASEDQSDEQAQNLMKMGLVLLQRQRLRRTSDADDLDSGIDHLRAAIEHPAASTLVVRLSRINLASALITRFEREREPVFLNEAVSLAAMEHTRSPLPPRGAVVLGRAFRHRYGYDQRADDLASGVDLLRHAARGGLESDVEAALEAATELTTWALERRSWEEASEAAELAARASDRALQIQLHSGRKYWWLRLSSDAPSDGAYALARLGRLQEAIDTIEGGRARLMAEALELDRKDLARLPELGHEDLYRRFTAAAQRIEAAMGSDATGDLSLQDQRRSAESLRNIHKQFNQIVAEIRSIRGYETLLKDMTHDQFAAVVETGPLIYLIVTNAGGLGLIVWPTSETTADGVEILAVWLDTADRHSLRTRMAGDGDELGGYLSELLLYRGTSDPVGLNRWREALNVMTGWLGATIMRPLVDALAQARVPVGTGVTLVADGLLGLLPLHAAWATTIEGEQWNVSDEFLIRYTSNARAVLAASDRLDRLGADQLLLVVDPQPTTATPLPGAAAEAARIIPKWDKGSYAVRWYDAATADDIEQLLDEHSVFHFAGHGLANLADPTQSGLLMANDEMLTVERLANRHLALRLAVLSACETGLPGALLPNEVIGLPTALVQAGACGVIASLWPVGDDVTHRLMDLFYSIWRRDELAPAVALYRAQAEMRDTGSEVVDWAAFTYTGI